MRTKEELKKLFDGEFQAKIAGMEKLRKRSLLWISVVIFMAVLIVALFQINILSNDVSMFFGFFTLMFGFILIFVPGFIAAASHHKYRKVFKQEVMQQIIKFINPDYHYSEMEYIEREDFEASGITRGMVAEYRGDDLITGTIDKTPFKFSELHVLINNVTKLEEKLRKGLDKPLSNLAETITSNFPEFKDVTPKATVGDRRLSANFHGLFFMADFNKHLNEKTFVVPEKSYTSFGKEDKSIKGYGELIKLENPEFEKIFSVYGSSQQEARYVLTPRMMEAMVEVQKKYNLNMRFSFKDANVYCAINIEKGLFEPTIKHGVKYENIEEMYDLLGLIETIITEMNLNTRIWTKE